MTAIEKPSAKPNASALEAVHLARRQSEPLNPEPLHHLGVLYAQQGRLTEAEAAFRRVLELAPGAHGTARLLGNLLLSEGCFDEGFAWFEARHLLPEMAKPQLPFPEWKGEDLTGKRLLIWPEQGFGDQIQFARFAPILQAQGVDVTLLCREPLARLFAGSLGVRVLAAAGSVEFPDPDAWVMTCSVAWRMGVGVDSIPAAPYLRPPLEGATVPARGRIGLATRGSPANDNDAARSLQEADAARLHAIPGVVDLDPAMTGARDFADTAAIIDQLDLVISVDTAVAHLAGAMGKPVWVLIPASRTDWRWMRGRRDSLWYPTMRLYRQTAPGDWSGALDDVIEDLARPA